LKKHMAAAPWHDWAGVSKQHSSTTRHWPLAAVRARRGEQLEPRVVDPRDEELDLAEPHLGDIRMTAG
jgi:hypothetical protein